MSELESVRIHCYAKLESVRIGKCQNWKVSELLKIGKCQNWKVSETACIGKCKNWNSDTFQFCSKWAKKWILKLPILTLSNLPLGGTFKFTKTASC